jgi:hypothetical protein
VRGLDLRLVLAPEVLLPLVRVGLGGLPLRGRPLDLALVRRLALGQRLLLGRRCRRRVLLGPQRQDRRALLHLLEAERQLGDPLLLLGQALAKLLLLGGAQPLEIVAVPLRDAGLGLRGVEDRIEVRLGAPLVVVGLAQLRDQARALGLQRRDGPLAGGELEPELLLGARGCERRGTSDLGLGGFRLDVQVGHGRALARGTS